MANPIVVFVVPGRFDDILNDKDAVGVTAEGNMETASEQGEYSLVLLDDSKHWNNEIMAPCKISNDDPLLIIVHKGTEKNAGTWETPLWGVNAPTVCKSFSHIDEDPVFVSIGNILRKEEGALDQFVQDCRDVNILQALDGLAAICQIEILNSSIDELVRLENEFLHRLSSAEELITECPREKLDLIRKKAESHLGITTKTATTSRFDRG